MSRLGRILAAAVVGVATASVVAWVRQQQRTPKKRDVEDIHRWEDEGGQVLARRQPSDETASPPNPG